MSATVDILKTAMEYARISERIRAAMSALSPALNAIRDIHDLEPALGPELLAAVECLDAALEALGRAAKFVDTRTDVTLSKIEEGL